MGDVFGSLFALAAGVLVIQSGVRPRWLGWVAVLVGILFFVQGFGLGGVIASFGLALDLAGFVLFLIFVLVSSVILLRRERALLRIMTIPMALMLAVFANVSGFIGGSRIAGSVGWGCGQGGSWSSI